MRAGLSDRHLRLLLQQVLDRALERMVDEGWSNDEVDHLRSASLYCQPPTSVTFDAPQRNMKDLQTGLCPIA